MIFPSHGDQETNDYTIERAMTFARKWKFGRLYIANLYAYRARNYREIKLRKRHGLNLKCEENKIAIERLI